MATASSMRVCLTLSTARDSVRFGFAAVFLATFTRGFFGAFLVLTATFLGLTGFLRLTTFLGLTGFFLV